jgi:hypothetical protein
MIRHWAKKQWDFECFRKAFTGKDLRFCIGRKPLWANDLPHSLFSVGF